MTMQPTPPSFSESMAWLSVHGETQAWQRVHDWTKDAMADEFGLQRETVVKSFNLQKPEPGVRLWVYYRKPQELWAEHQAKYPRSFAEDQADFAALREREAKGEIVATAPEQA